MRTITVRGRAELSREPDIAELVCTVRGEDLEYGAAYEKLIAAQGALFAAFRKEGYADKDFKTGAFRVSRKSAYEKDGNVNREVFGGYLFVNTVTLAFPCESARLGKAVGAAVGSGAGVDFFLRFSLRDEAAFKEKLLFAACADAKARAESIARAYTETEGEVFTRTVQTGYGTFTLSPALADIDFFKAGHHGSASSNGAALLSLCRPAEFFISCGAGNSYGHPSLTAIGNVLAASPDARILRTDELGSIMISVRADGSYDVRAVG